LAGTKKFRVIAIVAAEAEQLVGSENSLRF